MALPWGSARAPVALGVCGRPSALTRSREGWALRHREVQPLPGRECHRSGCGSPSSRPVSALWVPTHPTSLLMGFTGPQQSRTHGSPECALPPLWLDFRATYARLVFSSKAPQQRQSRTWESRPQGSHTHTCARWSGRPTGRWQTGRGSTRAWLQAGPLPTAEPDLSCSRMLSRCSSPAPLWLASACFSRSPCQGRARGNKASFIRIQQPF